MKSIVFSGQFWRYRIYYCITGERGCRVIFGCDWDFGDGTTGEGPHTGSAVAGYINGDKWAFLLKSAPLLRARRVYHCHLSPRTGAVNPWRAPALTLWQ